MTERTAKPLSPRPSAARYVFIALAACVGCASTVSTQSAPCPVVPQLTLRYVQGEITEYIDSGRYDATVAQVVSAARTWLEERAGSVTRPAIVLDIDETSLSNWPAYRINGWVRIRTGDCDLAKGPCNIRAWQA